MEPFIPPNLSRSDIAVELGVSRQTLDNYFKFPDRMRLGTYKKLVEIGVQMPTLFTDFMTCESCHGTGYVEVKTSIWSTNE